MSATNEGGRVALSEEDLEGLPEDAVVLDPGGDSHQKWGKHWYAMFGQLRTSEELWRKHPGAFKVLYTGTRRTKLRGQFYLDKDDLDAKIGEVLFNADNHPDPPQALGRNYAGLRNRLSREIWDLLRKSKTGGVENSLPSADDIATQIHKTTCRECAESEVDLSVRYAYRPQDLDAAKEILNLLGGPHVQ